MSTQLILMAEHHCSLLSRHKIWEWFKHFLSMVPFQIFKKMKTLEKIPLCIKQQNWICSIVLKCSLNMELMELYKTKMVLLVYILQQERGYSICVNYWYWKVLMRIFVMSTDFQLLTGQSKMDIKMLWIYFQILFVELKKNTWTI